MTKTCKTLLLLCCALPSIAHAQEIHIKFDYSNADATLAVLTASAGNAHDFEHLLTLPDTDAVVRKRAKRDPNVTLEIYRQTLLDVRAHRELKADPFQWQFCLQQAQNARVLLDNLHKNESAAIARVAAAIAPHLDPSMHLSVTVHFVIGGVSAGWESGDSDFYIGLPFYKGDMEGMIWTMQHELFHNAQAAGFHNQEKELAQLSPREQEVYRLLDELFREGTATYVGGLGSFPPDAPFIKEMRAPAATNWERMGDNFVLLDTLIYRLANDSSAHFADLETLGFDWDWQNPLYYAGDAMTRQLLGKNGTVRTYLRASPIVFARDYALACGPSSHCSYRMSSETVSTILAIAERLHEPKSPLQ